MISTPLAMPAGFLLAAQSGGHTSGEPHTLLTDQWVPLALVSLAADPRGRVWAAWEDRRGETRRVEVGFLDGLAPQRVDEPVIGYSPSITPRATGAATLVWQDGPALPVGGVRGRDR